MSAVTLLSAVRPDAARVGSGSPSPRARQGSGPERSRPGRVLVLGLGNPILGDDAVGWRVAEEVARRVAGAAAEGALDAAAREAGGGVEAADGSAAPAAEVDCAAVGGLSLMERLVGYRRAVLVDAIHGTGQPVGSVTRFRLEALADPSAGHTTSVHDTSLLTALAMGRRLGAELPEEVTVVAIEAQQVFDFSESLTPAVAAAVPRAAALVMEILGAAGVAAPGQPPSMEPPPPPSAASPPPPSAASVPAPTLSALSSSAMPQAAFPALPPLSPSPRPVYIPPEEPRHDIA